MAHERIVLGIDPGLATVGFGVIAFQNDQARLVDFGTMNTPAGLDFCQRLLMLQQDLNHLLERYQPTEAYVEELFFSANAKTAMSVAQARGVILVSLAGHGLQPHSVTPNQVKLAITGDGAADKRQVQDMLKIHLGLDSLPQPDDAADALAIALYGARLHFPR
jgi:crossover junction endodeoxyribonuclease RuvC